MKTNALSFTVLSGVALMFAAGCAHQEGSSSANFSEVPAYKHSSSDLQSSGQTTTITAPLGAGATVTRKSNSPNEHGVVIDQIQNTVLSDQKLVPYPSKITASMDPNSTGRVILSGSVPTKGVKEDVVKRVRALQGVADVDDRLTVEYPKTSREVDLRNAVKQ